MILSLVWSWYSFHAWDYLLTDFSASEFIYDNLVIVFVVDTG